jgi:putative FmdB family regulatory protein
MPTYSYACSSCEEKFELFLYIKDYLEHPKCPACKSQKTSRRYMDDVSTLNASVKKSDSELKSLGDLANRNRDRMSDDQKQSLHDKHNSYRETGTPQDLPAGMSRMKKPTKKIKWT